MGCLAGVPGGEAAERVNSMNRATDFSIEEKKEKNLVEGMPGRRWI